MQNAKFKTQNIKYKIQNRKYKEQILNMVSEQSTFFENLILMLLLQMASFQDSRSLYFVMTLGKRGDMFRFIKRMAAKEVDVTQFYAAELVQALQHLHSLKIVHRDLKPENILLE